MTAQPATKSPGGESKLVPGAAHERDVALCRSLLYQELSAGFSSPSEVTLVRIRSSEFLEVLSEAVPIIVLEGKPDLAPLIRALGTCPGEITPQTLSRTYQHLFGHTARGQLSAYETEYGEDTLFQKPQELADLAGFLRAFGLVVNSAGHERVDHISCELEFLAFLTRKEAHAIECGDKAMQEQTRTAVRLFLKDHLGRFVPSFTSRVMAEDRNGFYARLAALCASFVESECARLNAPLGPRTLRLRRAVDDGAPIACDTGEVCGPDGCPAVEGQTGDPSGGGILRIVKSGGGGEGA